MTYHDADATAFGYALGQIPQMPEKYEANEQLLSETVEVVQQQHFKMLKQV